MDPPSAQVNRFRRLLKLRDDDEENDLLALSSFIESQSSVYKDYRARSALSVNESVRRRAEQVYLGSLLWSPWSLNYVRVLIFSRYQTLIPSYSSKLPPYVIVLLIRLPLLLSSPICFALQCYLLVIMPLLLLVYIF